MEQTKQNLHEFTDLLASNEPAPGGGAVSALMGALGASLTMMVANLTVGRPKYAEYWEKSEQVLKDALLLKNKLLSSVEKDSDAYARVSEAYALPKETEEQKAHRHAKIQEGLIWATEVPFETMQLSLDSMLLAKSLIGSSNTNAASDLGVAALSLHAALRGAWLNVLINIGSIEDKSISEEYRKKGDFLVNEAQILANEIYVAVLAMI